MKKEFTLYIYIRITQQNKYTYFSRQTQHIYFNYISDLQQKIYKLTVSKTGNTFFYSFLHPYYLMCDPHNENETIPKYHQAKTVPQWMN